MKSRPLGYLVLVLTVVFALAPLYRGEVEFPVRIHHLLHAGILIGAALAGLLIARRSQSSVAARATWLVVSIIAPLLAMLLMWPSEYLPLDKLPAAHAVEHLALLFLGFLTAYAGQKYAYGVGAAMAFSLWAMAFLAAWGFGVSPSLKVSDVAPAAAAPAAPQTASEHAPAKAAHGKLIFAQNCSSCHGAQGQGGMGPGLVNEASRKNLRQAVSWIENPAPPMPKLYPSALSEQDVHDVAEYVESLK